MRLWLRWGQATRLEYLGLDSEGEGEGLRDADDEPQAPERMPSWSDEGRLRREWPTRSRRGHAPERASTARGAVMAEPSEGRQWHRLIRASVREACETWRIQAQAASVSPKDFEAIINRAAVPILRQLQEQPPELVAELVPSLVRIMLASAVEVMVEARRKEG